MMTRDYVPMQAFADRLPSATRFCTDPFSTSAEVIWPGGGRPIISRQKEATYTIESLNANLRTYLGRLARKSRCFSRSRAALQQALRLLVYQYNRRQRYINDHPTYKNRLPLMF